MLLSHETHLAGHTLASQSNQTAESETPFNSPFFLLYIHTIHYISNKHGKARRSKRELDMAIGGLHKTRF
jgi:hypothetical protein